MWILIGDSIKWFLEESTHAFCVPNFKVQRQNSFKIWDCQNEVMHVNFQNTNTTKIPLKAQWLIWDISQGLNSQGI